MSCCAAKCEGCPFERECCVEVPPMLTLDEVETLSRVYERALNDQLAAAMLADLDGNERGLTLDDMAAWAELADEFAAAILNLALWGDLDVHEFDEPLADWELALLADAATGTFNDGLGVIVIGPTE